MPRVLAHGGPIFLALLLVGGAFASPAEAGVSVRIEPEGGGALAVPFVVECRTHSYGVHMEHSKRRDMRVVATEEWTPLRTGLRSPVIFDRVSATAFHPAYMGDLVKSDSWMGTLVNARLPVLRPVAWRDAMPDGALPPNGHGPTRARVADHVRAVEEYYLPVLDRAGIDFGGAPLEDLRALVERGMQGAPPDDGYAAEGRANLLRLERFLAHPRDVRILVAGYRGSFGPWPLMDRYLQDSDRARVLGFLDESWPEERSFSWFNEETGIHYSFGIGRGVNLKWVPDQECHNATIGGDAGRIAGLDEKRLQASASTYYCRAPDGVWTQQGRYAPDGAASRSVSVPERSTIEIHTTRRESPGP